MSLTKIPLESYQKMLDKGLTPEAITAMGLEPKYSGTHEGRLLESVNYNIDSLTNDIAGMKKESKEHKQAEQKLAKFVAVKNHINTLTELRSKLNASIRECGEDLKATLEVTELDEETGKKKVIGTERVFPNYENKIVVKSNR